MSTQYLILGNVSTEYLKLGNVSTQYQNLGNLPLVIIQSAASGYDTSSDEQLK